MAMPPLRPLSIGEILDASFGMYRRLLGPLVSISLLCSGLPSVINVYLDSAGGRAQQPVLYLANLVLTVVLSALATAATVYLVSAGYLGRSLTAGEALGKAMPLTGQIFRLSISVGLVTFVGFVLLVIPGFIALCGYILSTQAMVIESLGVGNAMSRSWDLTKGYRWRMLGLLLTVGVIIGVLVVGVALLAGLVVGLSGEAGPATAAGELIAGIAAALVSLIVYPLFYCMLTITYYDLRIRKEGFDLELLASSLRKA